LANEFLMQGGRGKVEFKIIGGDHHEFRDFWRKFHDFWTNGAIRIKSEEKNRLIKGRDLMTGLSGYNLGTETLLGALEISNMHTQNQRRGRECHVATSHWVTSACQCHVVAPH
jgi:hypothetical protein